MVDFSKYDVSEHDEDKGEVLPAAYSISFDNLRIAYSNAYTIEQDSGGREELIETIKEYCSISSSTANNYIRMLEILDLLDTSKGIRRKKNLNSFKEFFSYYRNKLKELFAPIIEILNDNKALNYRDISDLAHENGYKLSPTKVRRIFSLLKGAGILTISKRIDIIEQKSPEEIIMKVLRTNGPMEVKKIKRKVRDLDQDSFKDALINLIENKKARISTYPRALKMLSRVMRGLKGKDTSVEVLTGGIWHKSKITKGLKENYDLNEGEANELMEWIKRERGDLISIEKDRMREEYANKKIPTFISSTRFWSSTDIIEVIQ